MTITICEVSHLRTPNLSRCKCRRDIFEEIFLQILIPQAKCHILARSRYSSECKCGFFLLLLRVFSQSGLERQTWRQSVGEFVALRTRTLSRALQINAFGLSAGGYGFTGQIVVAINGPGKDLLCVSGRATEWIYRFSTSPSGFFSNQPVGAPQMTRQSTVYRLDMSRTSRQMSSLS
jgi:hypothetical protein